MTNSTPDVHGAKASVGAHGERHYPWLISLIVALAAAHWLRGAQRVAVTTELANPILTLLAITVGFLAAALTILLTAQELRAIKKLRTTDHFRRLVDYHWCAISVGFCSAVLSLAVLIVFKFATDSFRGVPDGVRAVLFPVWVFFVSWAFTAFMRVIILLRLLLRL